MAEKFENIRRECEEKSTENQNTDGADRLSLAARGYKWLRGVRKVDNLLHKVGDLMDTVNELGDDPKVRNYIGVGSKVLRMGLGSSWIDPFQDDKMCNLKISSAYEDGFKKLITDYCPLKDVIDPGTGENDKYFIHDLYGTPLIISKRWDKPRYFKGANEKKIFLDFGRTIWENCSDGRWIQLHISGDWSNTAINFSAGRQGEIHNSVLAGGITERINNFLTKGIHRSVMLYGPPGTGKTSIINKIGENLGTRILSVEVGELASANSKDILYAVRLLDPDVLIVNDFDRFSGASMFLNTLEEMHSSIKLFMVSVNRKQMLPKAVLRPGRFDELIAVNKLDDGVAQRLLNTELDKETFDKVAKWPAAFIAELGRRIEILGLDKIKPELDELEERVRENNKQFELSDEYLDLDD